MPTALDVVVGGWQMRRHQHHHTGRDGDVHSTRRPAAFQVSAITNDFSGANNYRPNITCDPYAPSDRSRSPVVQPVVRRRCRPIRASRSATRRATTCAGPNFWQFDLAPSKNVALGGQRQAADSALEAFNLFNRVNFTAPAGNRSNATFGTITSTFDQRQVQLGVKVLW
jgi:hypothetical protein